MIHLIAVAGGIGAGKSYISGVLIDKGEAVLDADDFSREVMEPGTHVFDAVSLRWPGVIVNGRINRPALGKIVFSDDSARAELESIVHPRIQECLHDSLDALETLGVRRAFYEVPLLLKAQEYTRFSASVIAHAPAEQRVARIMARNKLTEAEARARLAAQPDPAQLLRVGDYIIDTSQTKYATRKMTREVLSLVREKFC